MDLDQTCSILNYRARDLASVSGALDAPSVKLSRKELPDIAVSNDRLVELHAAGKLSKQQLLYLKLPVDADVPNEVCATDQPNQVIQDSTTAGNDVRDDWVSELL